MEHGKRINWYEFSFWGDEKKYVNDALDSTWISGGAYIERFEKELKRVLDLDHVLVVSNGTAALQLALLGIGIKPGDEVIVPAFGFLAVANLLKQMHAEPVFADVDPYDWCLDPAGIESCITDRTRAIAIIHNYGVMAKLNEVQQIARKHGLLIVEDAAEAIFSRYDDKYCGSFGDVSTFSFHATKTIATGEGGMVSCKSDDLFDKLKLIRSHGLRREKKHYWHEDYGNNFRMSNIMAAIGLAQFEKREDIQREKKRVLKRYKDKLSALPGVRFQQYPANSDPLIWVVAIYLDPENIKVDRDNLMERLQSFGIECRPGFYTPDQLEIYRDNRKHPNAIANRLASNIIVLPSYPRMTSEQIDYVCEVFKKELSDGFQGD